MIFIARPITESFVKENKETIKVKLSKLKFVWKEKVQK